MRRFIIPPDLMDRGTITIQGDLFRHMARVLRLHPGDRILLSDGSGSEGVGTITDIESRSLTVELSEIHRSPVPVTSPAITLIQALPKSDRFDLIVQKVTELGIAAIIPFPASRSVVRISSGLTAEKVARWQKIARDAARQSERHSVPVITFAENLDSALRNADQPVKLILMERDGENRLQGILAGIQNPDRVAILVGPEGGFTNEECRNAQSSGFLPISLGSRILRTETASIAMMAILQYQWGDMG
jgi:16S rRNA (uracil1498-N3)-methyltransferase